MYSKISSNSEIVMFFGSLKWCAMPHMVNLGQACTTPGPQRYFFRPTENKDYVIFRGPHNYLLKPIINI